MKGLFGKSQKGSVLMVKNLVLVGLFIMLIVAPAETVHAQSLPDYCGSLNGTWHISGCTIPAGETGVIPKDVTVAIYTDQQLFVAGNLIVNGTLSIQGGHLDIFPGGTVTNNNIISISSSSEEIRGLANSGTLINKNSIVIEQHATVPNNDSTLWNNSLFRNEGSLTIRGKLDNKVGGTFINEAGGTLNLFGRGYYYAATQTTNTNNGTINVNESNGRILVESKLTNYGLIENKGNFTARNLINESGGIIFNIAGAEWHCGGTDVSLTNKGAFTNNSSLYIKNDCTFSNEGRLINNHSIILPNVNWWNVVQLNNISDGVIEINSGSMIELGSFTNLNNFGLIEHRGQIKAGSGTSGTLNNHHVINQYCGSSITVSYGGAQPVNHCIGTIVITKVTDQSTPTTFSFTGDLGSFTLQGSNEPNQSDNQSTFIRQPGSYSVTEAVIEGFALTAISCSSNQASNTTTVNLATRTADINLRGDINETVTCTFTNTFTCISPKVTTQPVNQNITYGQDASFTVQGTNYTSVQWQVNTGTVWSNITGANATNYTLPKPSITQSGNQYRAVLSSSCEPSASSNAATLTVNKAPVTATAGNYNGTYNDADHSPTACVVTGTYMGDLSCTNNPGLVGPDVGSGVISPVVSGTGLDNYAITEVNGTWSITPAPVTATTGSYSGTYDGDTHSPLACAVTGTYTGNLSCTNDPLSVGPNVGSGNVAPILVLNGETENNFTVTSHNGSWLITPAPVTITAGSYSGTYDGAAHSPSACAVTGTYTGNLSCTNNPASVGPNVGSGSVAPVLVLNGETEANFTVSSMNGSWEIEPAETNTTVTCDPASVTYNGLPHEHCTAAVSGPGGLDQPLDLTYHNNINAGTATASASYTGGDNWLSSSDSQTFTIIKAATETTVTCDPTSVTYNGSSQEPCTAAVTGPGGLEHQLVDVSYHDNINAGTATASASYAGGVNWLPSSDSQTFIIKKGIARVNQWPAASAITYGQALSASTLSGGSAIVDGSFVFADGTVTPEAGTYTAEVIFTPDDEDNYNNANGSVEIVITKAETVTVVTCPISVTYSGLPQTRCSAAVTGPELNTVLTVTYQDNTNAGTATASASYAGGDNWQPSSDSTTFIINKAWPQVTTWPTASTITYGQPLSASSLSDGSVNVDGSFTFTDGMITPEVGTYTAEVIFTPDDEDNYNTRTGTVEVIVERAETVTNVICPESVYYIGISQTPCMAEVTGPGGLAELLAVMYENNVNAGTATASASYAGGDNWLPSSDSKTFTIEKAESTTAITCPESVPFIGSPQTPCTAVATGPGGLNVSLAVMYHNNVDPGTAIALASYYGGDNWLASSDIQTFTISQDVPEMGELKISKVFNPLISGFSGKFTINYDCGADHKDTVALGAGEDTTISAIPIGTECTVTEPTLPTPPAGWTFGPPTFNPSNGTVTISGTPAEVTVTNTISPITTTTYRIYLPLIMFGGTP